MLGTNSSTYTPYWLPTAGATQKLGKQGIQKHKRRAQLASEAYLKPEERRHEIGGYFLDNSLSDKRTAVYHNPKKNKTFMALRGTDFKDVGDLHMDKHILDGSQRDHAFFNPRQQLIVSHFDLKSVAIIALIPINRLQVRQMALS